MNQFSGLLLAVGGALLTVVGVLPVVQSGAALWAILLAIGGATLVALGLVYQFKEFLVHKFGDKSILLRDLHSVSEANDDDAKWIYERAQRQFGTDVTPLNQINLIRGKYPDSFKVIWFNTKNYKERRGYISAFPINEEACVDISSGNFSVVDLEEKHIPTKLSNAEAFYVGAILSDDRRAGIFLIHELRRMISEFKKTRKKIVYTRPVNSTGMRYVKANDFMPVREGEENIGDLFYIQL